MKKTKTIRTACLLFFNSILWLAAGPSCVTVNVNFPEAAVQQATDDYVQDLYRAKEKGRVQPTSGSPVSTPSAKPDSALRPSNSPKSSFIQLNLISEAFATEGSQTNGTTGGMKIKMDSPRALAIRDRQIARLDKIRGAEEAGQVGETNDGLLALDPGSRLKPMDKSRLQPLVDAENKDRKELYEAVLTSNGATQNRLIDLEKSFARSFQRAAASGTWIQDDDGKWSQKP